MRMWPTPLPVKSRIGDVVLAGSVQNKLDRLSSGDGPRGITIGRRGSPPRALVFTGTCSEKDVGFIRDLLKLHDSKFEASLIKTVAKLHVYKTVSLERHSGMP